MKPIPYIERTSGRIAYEKVFGGKLLQLLYGEETSTQWFWKNLVWVLAHNSWISSLVGWYQKRSFTKSEIRPFLDYYEIDEKEFLLNTDAFQSFNDFFIRKLKASARPINLDPKVAVMPADARYWFFENIQKATPFNVKGKLLDLPKLLQDEKLVAQFKEGSLVMARLCPTDYHRFHFPCDCLPSEPRLINGPLYSVNPIALKQNLHILCENKRVVTLLQTEKFGTIAYIEVGATSVGSIVETYTPHVPNSKGAEKGYFEFGGSSLLLLFEKDKIAFSPDLLSATQKGYEIRCLLGQEMGVAISS